MEERYEKRGYLLEDFRLFHLKDGKGTNVGFHYHEFCKLVILLSGTGAYTVEGRRYPLSPGDIVLINSRSVHRPEFKSGISYERYILYISPEFLRRESAEDFLLLSCFSGANGHVLRPRESFRRSMTASLEKLERVMSRETKERPVLSRCALLEFLVALNIEMELQGREMPLHSEAKDGKILEILRYLEENISEEIRIDELAARFYISKFHMMRRFREETGCSIHSYLSDKRLLLARGMIRSGVSATDACFQCGFKSYSAFSRAYGKLFGMTPTGRECAGVMEYDIDE